MNGRVKNRWIDRHKKLSPFWMCSSDLIFIFPTSPTAPMKYLFTESLHPFDIWLYDNFGSCNRTPVLIAWKTFQKVLTFIESMRCCCKGFTDSMSFNPYRNSLKYYHLSDADVSKTCFTVILTHLLPKIVFLTLTWRHLPWACWNLKVAPWGWCKQTPQVILLKVVHGPQFKKLYFDVYRYRLRIFAICQNDACVWPASLFVFFYIVGGSELNLKWLKWSNPLT